MCESCSCRSASVRTRFRVRLDRRRHTNITRNSQNVESHARWDEQHDTKSTARARHTHIDATDERMPLPPPRPIVARAKRWRRVPKCRERLLGRVARPPPLRRPAPTEPIQSLNRARERRCYSPAARRSFELTGGAITMATLVSQLRELPNPPELFVLLCPPVLLIPVCVMCMTITISTDYSLAPVAPRFAEIPVRDLNHERYSFRYLHDRPFDMLTHSSRQLPATEFFHTCASRARSHVCVCCERTNRRLLYTRATHFH